MFTMFIMFIMVIMFIMYQTTKHSIWPEDKDKPQRWFHLVDLQGIFALFAFPFPQLRQKFGRNQNSNFCWSPNHNQRDIKFSQEYLMSVIYASARLVTSCVRGSHWETVKSFSCWFRWMVDGTFSCLGSLFTPHASFHTHLSTCHTIFHNM